MIWERFQNYIQKFMPHKYKVKLLRSRGAKIGREVHYQTQCLPFSGNAKLLSIGDYSSIAPGVTFIHHAGVVGSLINRNPKFVEKNIHVYKKGKITIGNHVVIGVGVIILPSVTIGDFSVIGSGSVVTKNVPAGQIWAGSPAKFIKYTIDFVEETLKSNQIVMNRSEIEKCLTFTPRKS